MSGAMIALWVLVGWCGTPWPRPWPWPPGPDPDPWILKVVGVIGGVAGGWAFNQLWPAGDSAAGMTLTAVGAWVGANILVNAYGLVAGRKKAG